MTTTAPERPVIFVLHGARGDLAKRMVIPGLAELSARGLLPERWALLGTGRAAIDSADFAQIVRSSLETFGPADKAAATQAADALTARASYAQEVVEGEPDGALTGAVAALRHTLATGDNTPDDVLVIHYLAVPPTTFVSITRALGEHGLTKGSRVVYEKPYGTSPDSFRELDDVVHGVLKEEQVFRIDHFLGKEATQNLHVLRFANELFGGVWNREHVEQVQIDVPETLDITDRAEFYDATGAALDMLVTHLFQVAAEVAMEPPHGLDADHVSPAREAAISCFRPLDLAHDVVLGQFDGYQAVAGIADGSTTDTFVAARLWIDNDRWRGVPFLLRTGKRMAVSAQRVTLVLRTPKELFGEEVGPDRISLSLSGDGAIEITTTVKRPGPDLTLGTGTARLALDDVAPGEPLSPYASLVHDVIIGDRSLFTTPAGLRDAWRAFAPLLGPDRPQPLPYRPGSWGPAEARALAAPGGWVLGD
ncbi:glucose-6-phosphate dehydrogenase [Sanguibacter gelidistatuariae]|uniref:glucose-6-phosphate dehydrogenase n=1 Tax=Sanguibacter gelidistatuariae TaxID=1814289 RepID=UPI001FE039A4|nr:glucose-6-phosphate dehydrogenase [Sanguibacter gelidistatuariae]